MPLDKGGIDRIADDDFLHSSLSLALHQGFPAQQVHGERVGLRALRCDPTHELDTGVLHLRRGAHQDESFLWELIGVSCLSSAWDPTCSLCSMSL